MNARLLTAVGVGITLLLAGCSGSEPASTAISSTSSTSAHAHQHGFEAGSFADGAIVGDVTTEECTLSGGTTTTCASVTIAGYPASYAVGPFCPKTITTPAKDAGIWFDGSGVYDLDGAFIKGLAEFYKDGEWKLYNDNGTVKITNTQQAFEGAARPDVEPQYQNHCVEGQLSWLADGKPIQTTMLIPTTPIMAASASSAHPGNLGITLDGVIIAESAPVDAILGAHTIAAFDDCGGHYNPVAGYHLHGVTGCGHLDGQASTGETKTFGYAADGYPIHLPLQGAALTATGLDECNGHSTASEGYHYHANNAAKNAILPCLKGEYVATAHAGGPPPEQSAGTQPSPGQTGAALDLGMISSLLGVTEHELQDAIATRNIDDAAALLGMTPKVMAKKLGVSVAQLQTTLAAQIPGQR